MNNKSLRLKLDNKTLGEWLRDRRTDEGWTVARLAQASGTDIGTISRIENNITQPTVLTMCRLGKCLAFSWHDLRSIAHFEDAHGNVIEYTAAPDGGKTISPPGALSETSSFSKADSDLLTEKEVLEFTAQFFKNPLAAGTILNDCMRVVLTVERFPLYLVLNTEPQRSADLTWFWLPSEVFQMVISYPKQYEAARILEDYLQGGVINADDVAHLAREYLPTSDLAEQSEHLLRRLAETALERVKFVDILELEYANRHILSWSPLQLYWQATTLFLKYATLAANTKNSYQGLITAEGATQIGTVLIRLFRWMQCLDIAKTEGLPQLQKFLNRPLY
jgi:transcriptional regulator with XRE-family HTH domain